MRLSSNYPEPVANPAEDPACAAEQPKLMSTAPVQAAKQVLLYMLDVFIFVCDFASLFEIVGVKLENFAFIV